jgi:hypothetical protein
VLDPGGPGFEFADLHPEVGNIVAARLASGTKRIPRIFCVRVTISPSYPSPTFLNEPMIIVLSPGLYRAATTVASMAIDSPETTGGAPACRP